MVARSASEIQLSIFATTDVSAFEFGENAFSAAGQSGAAGPAAD
jgi:hypothetical protein